MAEKETKERKEKGSNPMRNISIEKITLNVGAGKDPKRLEKGLLLIKHVTGKSPVKTITTKRIAQWGLRPGLPIGCKITLREEKHHELLKRLIQAVDSKFHETNFDEEGNISFGIKEYIDIPGVKYSPEIGIMGMQVCIRLKRPGLRITKRKLVRRSMPRNHRIAREEAVEFMKKKFNIIVEE